MRRYLVIIECNVTGIARYDIVNAKSKAACYDLCKIGGYSVIKIDIA